jgi:hypothetical protein
MKGTSYGMSIERRERACMWHIEAAKTRNTRDYVISISRTSNLLLSTVTVQVRREVCDAQANMFIPMFCCCNSLISGYYNGPFT